MKKEDFDDLKQFCDQKGYELLNESLEDNIKFFVVRKKKDIWEGVEFGECINASCVDQFIKGRIYKIQPNYKFLNFKPSTEQAYVDQLKAETFKRFGDIKIGDSFIDAYSGQKLKTGNRVIFIYDKNLDALAIGGVIIYSKGKWATRVPERVKVEFVEFDYRVEPERRPVVTFEFFAYPKGDLKKAGEFLASQLEEFINK